MKRSTLFDVILWIVRDKWLCDRRSVPSTHSEANHNGMLTYTSPGCLRDSSTDNYNFITLGPGPDHGVCHGCGYTSWFQKAAGHQREYSKLTATARRRL